MRVTITIDTDNAAFETEPEKEVARILGGVMGALYAESRLADTDGWPLRDINGNTVGKVEVTED